MAPARGPGPSAADATRAYIEEHPSVRDALRDDVVDYEGLARRILSERPVRNQEAVEIAIRRYQQELRSLSPAELTVRSILRQSRLEVRSRMALVRLRPSRPLLDRLYQLGRTLVPTVRQRKVFQIIEGNEALTILLGDDLLPTVLRALPAASVLRVERNLAAVSFRGQPLVGETPGIMAVFAEALFHRGLNALDTVSVHTDSIFVFRERDVIRAYSTLQDLIEVPHAGALRAGRPVRGRRAGQRRDRR